MGVAFHGVLPYLVGLRREIHFRIVITVKNAGVLRIEIAHGLLVALVFEERLIAPHDFRILVQTLSDTTAQTDDPLNTIGGEERITADLLRHLADTVNASGSLDQSNNGPWKVVIHNNGAILQVLSFA